MSELGRLLKNVGATPMRKKPPPVSPGIKIPPKPKNFPGTRAQWRSYYRRRQMKHGIQVS